MGFGQRLCMAKSLEVTGSALEVIGCELFENRLLDFDSGHGIVFS
jgi:hypothetical protein